ncbi:MAG: adenosylcobinamide amidohydrolase [Candidatus Verstraetearchaeota archaeon]|nr:adenosylcobinamide amidohydrolase [Candidatus Verstraetearchaeota archaeon]
MKERRIDLDLEGVEAKIVYHNYEGYDLNTLIVAFRERRRVLSTIDGYRTVRYVGNNYTPLPLSEETMRHYKRFKRRLPLSLGIRPCDISFLGTGVNMDELAVRECSYEELKVCCLATAGAKGNAMRAGVDGASYIERNGKFVGPLGTINIILLTNARLSCGAMARSIVTVTEAKSAALQDLNIKSTYSPNQATGTGTDNVIVVSARSGKPLLLAGGHTKLGELTGRAAKDAVTEALRKHHGL